MNNNHRLVDQWLETHPYLADIGRFQQGLDGILQGFSLPAGGSYDWEKYSADYQRGIPLLKSASLSIQETASAPALFHQMIQEALALPAPLELKKSCEQLAALLASHPAGAEAAIDAVLRGESAASEEIASKLQENSGLVWYFGWSALARVLQPVVTNFTLWRNDDQWMRGYCPTCGSLPAMAQLVRSGKGRERYLSCGCCQTRWLYKRIGCPYCGNEEQEKLPLLDLEQEEDLRINTCQDCHGYLKCYTNEGEESLMLADWSTLHLDLLCRERGLQRPGASLYHL